MQRTFNFSEGEFYHIYNRGTEKRDIFIDDHDRRRFIKLLYAANGSRAFKFRDIQDKSFLDINRGDPLVAIGAYVLMPNHFHLLVREIVEDGISEYMGKLLTAYSMYFNKRHARTGRLFQNVFQAQHADDDAYLKYLIAYIHLNPVKLIDPTWKEKGIRSISAARKFLDQYQFSSCADYRGVDREEAHIISRDEFPEYFASNHEFDAYLNDWITFSEEASITSR